MKRNRIGIAVITALFAAIITGGQLTSARIEAADSAEAVTYTIGYLPITHALPVFEEKELLEAEDTGVRIELQKFSSWSDLTDALHAGKIDGASELIELAMSAKAKGVDLKAVALGHRDGNVIVTSVCNMGPCKITPKSPKGVCGADADLIAARNLLRGAAAGAAQHGMHAREVILMLKWAAEGRFDLPIIGEYKVRQMAEAYGIPTKKRQLKNIAKDLTDVLLADLSRTEPDPYRTIQACAPKERQETWEKMDILPISAYHEVFEAYHKSGCATDGDFDSIMKQFLRCGLAFTFSGVVSTSIATDALLGVGDRVTSKVNIGALKKGYVNIAVHGHLPGAEHIGFDHHHSNVEEIHNIAEKIVTRAIESFEARKGMPVFIPPYEVEAEVGFSVEYVHKHYGGFAPIADAIRKGQILGVVNMVGCNNPKIMYEKAVLDVCDVLLKNNVLIITNGCASFPLMKMGYCQTSDFAYGKCGDGLREFLAPDMPPVWHVGECIDNARSSGIFAGIAGEFGKNLYEMPFAFSSPEWSNEKGIDAALGFRLMGITSYHCVEAPIHGAPKLIKFLKEDTKETLHSSMVVDADPVSLGEKIVADLKKKREALGI